MGNVRSSYEHQNNLKIPDLLVYAESLALPVEELELAIEKDIFEGKIKNDFMGGVRSGVNGTPTFFINGVRHNDSFEYEVLLNTLNEAGKLKSKQ